MKLKDHVGKRFKHPSLIKVEVLKVVPKSRTRLVVKCIDRGPGYDKDLKRYTGVRTPGGWFRGQNRRYGEKFEIHYQELKQ